MPIIAAHIIDDKRRCSEIGTISLRVRTMRGMNPRFETELGSEIAPSPPGLNPDHRFTSIEKFLLPRKIFAVMIPLRSEKGTGAVIGGS